MAVPDWRSYTTSYATATQSSFTLNPPDADTVGFYVVRLDFPGGSDESDWTPSTSPAFVRPRDTYSQVWPTSTPWEQPWFALAVRGSIDLPTMEWIFPTDFISLTVAAAFIDDCTFLLRASNITNAADDQLSPAAQPGALYSFRGAVGVGDTLTGSPPVPQVVSVAETSTVPEQAVDPNPILGASFSAIYATVFDVGPPTLPNDLETFDVSTWATNSGFFPDVWGSTLSIYAPADAPEATYGWHTGRIGWG